MVVPTNPHQRGIIKRYYEKKEDLMMHKLSEIISDLYLCDDPGKEARLWKSAGTALKNLGAPSKKIERCVDGKDLEMLARMIEDIY